MGFKTHYGPLSSDEEIGRYLKQTPRVVVNYDGITKQQGEQLVGNSDTDGAGCHTKINNWNISPVWQSFH